MEQWSDYLQFIIALFVIVNPFGAVPIFLGLTSGQSTLRRNQTARTATLTTGTVLMVSVLAGEPVLRLFGINVASFQVGGGILILLMAVSMLNAQSSRTKQTPEEEREAEQQESIGAVPLGTPLLAGPGAISTSIIYAHRAASWTETCLLLGVCALVASTVWFVLRSAQPVGVVLGRTGINILTRIMGLVLAAVAVRFIVDGLTQLLPWLAAK